MDNLEKQLETLRKQTRSLESEKKQFLIALLGSEEERMDALRESMSEGGGGKPRKLLTCLAPGWRVALSVGSTISLSFSIYGAVTMDDWWASMANMMWIFSCICCGALATSNPKQIERKRERFGVMAIGIVVGLPGVITGLQLITHTESHVRITGGESVRAVKNELRNCVTK